jgi:hypothetical protein
VKISSAAERDPLAVGIGDGSGIGIWLLHRVIGIATKTTSLLTSLFSLQMLPYNNENHRFKFFKSDLNSDDVVLSSMMILESGY